MTTKSATPIVLAMNSQMQCHAYGPFHSEQDAEIWAKAQNDNPTEREYQYVVIAMLPARVTISATRR